MLIDFYGGLLTIKQYNIIDMYYSNDYSLSEIGEILEISRQGVFDGLKRAETLLYGYEEKLKIVQRFIDQDNKLRFAVEKLLNKDNNYIEECTDILQKLLIENEI